MGLELLDHRWLLMGQCELDELASYPMIAHYSALRVRIECGHIKTFKKALMALSSLLAPRPQVICLLQVRYTVDALSVEARQAHQNFADQHPWVSTYLPLCLPPSPLADQVAWATPNNCQDCIFLEAKACGGLTGDECSPHERVELFARDAGGALSGTWPEQVTKAHISGPLPVCYWWPSPPILSILSSVLQRFNVRVLWDIGGSNGFISWQLSRLSPSLTAYNIDPIANRYPPQEKVKSLSMTAEQALVSLKKAQLSQPDLICISWPSTGISYQSLLHDLKPKLIIRATDEEKICGVRRGHRAIEIRGETVQVFGLAEALNGGEHEYDDLDTPDGYKVIVDEPVWAHRDLNRDAQSPSGRLLVYALQSLKN